MTRQSIRHLDAFILREFEEAVVHLRHHPADQVMQAEMRKLTEPFLDRLKKNGHSLNMAISLLKDVFDHQPPSILYSVPSPGIYQH